MHDVIFLFNSTNSNIFYCLKSQFSKGTLFEKIMFNYKGETQMEKSKAMRSCGIPV